MRNRILDLIDFEKVDTLLEGFNKSTGFVTAILDLDGNVLSKSGWRQICTEFHRIHPETAKKCLISDTELANKMAEGEKYHFYQCLNGLVDVAVPIVIRGEHIANLFSGQFFFEEPDESFFQKQATKFGFVKENYRDALKKVPVVSKEKVIVAMDFLLNMTKMISEMTFQKLEQMELNDAVLKSENILRLFVEHSPASIAMFDNNMRYLVASHRFLIDYNLGNQELIGRSHYEVFPEISERWKEFHRRGLAGETLKESNDPFLRADGTTDWVRWEIRPWYETGNQIGGIILFSEVITEQIEAREALIESEKYNRMLFEQSAIGLALTSFDGRLVDINTTFSNIVGRTVEEAKALNYWDITPEKYAVQEKLQLELLAKTGHYGPYEKEYIHKDGHQVPVRLQGLIIERNKEKFIWSSVEDITERKMAESELLAKHKLLTDTLESMSDAFVSLDRNWCYTYMNEKAGAIFGRNPKEMIGKNIWTEFPEGVGQPFQLNYEKVMNEKVFIRMEEYYPPYNMWFENRINPTDDGIAIFFQNITERKLAELEQARMLESEKAALSEATKAKEQLSQILERISDGFGSFDRDWNYIFVNEKLAKNVGRKREELLGRNIWEVFPEAIGTPVYKAYLRAMEKQEVIDLEHFYPHLGKWFQHRFYPSPDGLSVFSKDITESKLAEEKIKEHSSLVRIAAEKAKLGGWNVNLKENRSYWSDGVAAIHEMPPGYTPLVEDGINFYAPEWRERIIKVFTDCTQNGVTYDEEMEIITSTGKRVWVRTIGEAVRDENGKIFKVQGAFQDISERKIAEAKSREKDLQFRKLSANLPDLLFQFTKRPDGTYCVPVASEGIKNIFGCSPEDVVDDFTPIGKVIYPEDAERVIADIENSAKNLTYFTCEFRVLIPGRPIQWILSRSTPEKLPDGSITWYGFNADITKRKEFEDALRESEGKFRKIYEEGPFGMALVNREFKFMMVNRTFCEITGYTESELRELTFRDISHPEDKDIGIESAKKLIKGDIPVYRSEKRYVKKDGSVIWGAITVTANFDKNGNFLYNVAIVEDITGRKLAEENLHRHSERLRNLHLIDQAILQAIESPEAVVQTAIQHIRELLNCQRVSVGIFDPEKKEVLVYAADVDSKSIVQVGKILTEEVYGVIDTLRQSKMEIIEDMSMETSPSLINLILQAEGIQSSINVALVSELEMYGVLNVGWEKSKTISDEETEIVGEVANQITIAIEKARLLNETRQHAAELEERIRIRTAQLVAANKELETFTYSVSHDLKAPLRGIDGYSKLLHDLYAGVLPDEAKSFVSTIRSSTKQMNQLIEDLLEYSRLERSQFRNEKIKIRELIASITLVYRNELETGNFTLITNITDIDLVADEKGLTIALRNLIENALKFSAESDHPEIEIEAKENTTSWIIRVTDNGIGFDMKYSERIFEIFQRLQLPEDYPGTGIGLALVSKAMQRMQGKAWATSKPGHGSSFYLEIPKTN